MDGGHMAGREHRGGLGARGSYKGWKEVGLLVAEGGGNKSGSSMEKCGNPGSPASLPGCKGNLGA